LCRGPLRAGSLALTRSGVNLLSCRRTGLDQHPGHAERSGADRGTGLGARPRDLHVRAGLAGRTGSGQRCMGRDGFEPGNPIHPDRCRGRAGRRPAAGAILPPAADSGPVGQSTKEIGTMTILRTLAVVMLLVVATTMLGPVFQAQSKSALSPFAAAIDQEI